MTELPSVQSSRSLSCSRESSYSSSDPAFLKNDDQDYEGEFWKGIETFLNKPPPNFKNISNAEESMDLPELMKERSRLRHETGAGIISTERKKKLNHLKLSNHAGIGSHGMNMELVNQAFEYADKLKKQELMGNLDSRLEIPTLDLKKYSSFSSKIKQISKTSSIYDSNYNNNDETNVSASKNKTLKKKKVENRKSSGKKSKVSLDKKNKLKKTKVQVTEFGPGHDLGEDKTRHDLSHTKTWDCSNNENIVSSNNVGKIDSQTMQQLVSNFQNGLTIQQLKNELQASQQSLNQSRHILQQAAKEFFK